MKVDKMSISMDAATAARVRAAARGAGQPLSAWMAEAAQAKLRSEGLHAFLREYEEEYGAFTEAELAQARRELGLDAP